MVHAKPAMAFLALMTLVVSAWKSQMQDEKKAISIKGSDLMAYLGQQWAEAYTNAKPEITLQVTGGGSGTGIAALIDGGTDLAATSRAMKDREKEQLKKKQNNDAFEIPVAMDGLAIYVHEENPLSEISLDQLKAIYTGKSKVWKDLSGKEMKDADTIVCFGREENSGAFFRFRSSILGEADLASSVQSLPGSAAVIRAVSKERGAIGYGMIGQAKGVKALKVKKDSSSPSIEPTAENVAGGQYPLSWHLYLYTSGAPQGKIREFIEWVLSKEGQSIVEKSGYIPIPEGKRLKFN